MGGGKRKFNQAKYVSKEKKLGKFVEEEKKEHKKEDVNELLSLWAEHKKKKESSQ